MTDVYLEETYVRSIQLGRDVRVDLDCALLPGHRLYAPPPPGSVNHYVGASLVFRGVTRVEWDDPSDTVYSDGQSSWVGELDEFVQNVDGSWWMSGAYGSVLIWAAGVEISWSQVDRGA